MPARRGRSPEFPHIQCARCHKILRGRHVNTNPGRKVFYHDEHGSYATVEEAQANGLDASQSHAYGHGTTTEWDEEHAYGHHHCEACTQKGLEEDRIAYQQWLEERAARQREASAEAAEAPPEGEE